MELPLPKLLKHLWEIWEVRGCILFSLFLQCFLILLSPLRKRVSNIFMYMSIWSAYLLADWVAGFTIGQISTSQNDKQCDDKKGSNPDIYAFWASFLLLHLGGPDTISAFALEDNELWRRHMLTLVFQSLSALYVFYQTLPKNQVWIPTFFVFVCGIIKYGERTYSLFLASLDTFRDTILREPDPGPNYAKLMSEYHSMKDANLPTTIRKFKGPKEPKSVDQVREGLLSPTEVVLHAQRLFDMLKGLIVDITLGFRERTACRDFFLQRTAEDAFSVVEAELNLIYDVLFTKVPVVNKKIGYALRFFCSSLTITSLGLFYFQQKSNLASKDIAITYTLLFGAISLDIIAFVMLVVSDWIKVKTHQLPPANNIDDDVAGTPKNLRHSILCKLLHWLLRRWSESVPTYNLIYYSRKPRNKFVERIYDVVGLTNFLDGLRYVKREPFKENLRDHIFGELKQKSERAVNLGSAMELSAAKGDWTLRVKKCNYLLHYILDVDYDQSLLLWHIATELCYHDEGSPPDSEDEKKYREFSKLLSDYMLYLLVMQPTMMSAVAGIGQIRFRDTCAEAKKFFLQDSGSPENNKAKWIQYLLAIFGLLCRGVEYLLSPLLAFLISLYLMVLLPLISVLVLAIGATDMQIRVESHYKSLLGRYSKKKKEDDDKKHADFCKKILSVHTDVEPVMLKGEKSKSVLFDGCRLAKDLKNLKDDHNKKWEIISKVWVELLSHAAINCRARTHAQELAKGGQLLTVVWLLMVQFGLGTQFQIEGEHARAKLKVGK